jgi:hypothetical protein
MTTVRLKQLEKTIFDLLKRKYEAPIDSAERRMVINQLNGLRLSYEAAGPIMEDLDPNEWGATTRHPRADPKERRPVSQLHPGRKPGSRRG